MTVLYEWKFAGYVCRIVETEPGIVHFEQAQESTIPLAPGHHLAFNRTEKPLGCANEIVHLSQALAEANVINRDLSKAIQGWQEDRNRRENELAHLTARMAELEAKNAKLRACVKASDDARGDGCCPVCDSEAGASHWIDCPWRDYDAARAEVDR